MPESSRKGILSSVSSFLKKLTPIASTEDRKAQSEKILEKYPDKIPVICEKHETSTLKGMDRTK